MQTQRNYWGLLCCAGVVLSAGPVAGDVQVNSNPAKNPEVVVIHYHKKWDYTSVVRQENPWNYHGTEDIRWDLQQPGSWTWDECYGAANEYGDDYYYSWADGRWATNGVGTQTGNLDRGPKGEVCGVQTTFTNLPFTAPTGWAGESCVGGESREVFDGIAEFWDQVVKREARTRYELRTGGKKLAGRKNLFVLTASALGQANLFYPEIDPTPETYAIANEKIVLGDVGRLGSDGRLYAALADGEPYRVTPTVGGSRYYTYGPPDAAKHKLWIRANGAILNLDELLTKPVFCVGQLVAFTSDWDQTPPAIASTTNKWELGGNFVNEADHPCTDCSVNYTNNADLLTNNSTSAWWTSGGSGYSGEDYHAELKAYLTFSNGQSAEVTAEGKFAMHRPKLVNYTLPASPVHGSLQHFHWFGDPDPFDYLKASPPGEFTIGIESAFDGRAGITQLMNGTMTNQTCQHPVLTQGTNQLDVQEWYPNTPIDVATGSNINEMRLLDRPGLQCISNTVLQLDFIDYVRFKPGAGNPDANIYVTLGTVTWDVHASTSLTNVTGPTFSFYDYAPARPSGNTNRVDIPVGSAHIDSSPSETEEFPRWQEIGYFEQ